MKSIALQDCYSTPQNLFGQGIYYKVYISVIVDMRRVTHRGKGGWELVFPREAVHLHQLHIRANPIVNSYRLQGCEPWMEEELEGMPPVTKTVRGPPIYDCWYN